MGETKTHHVYDFGISEPVIKPQNQLFLFLETPGHLKQTKRIPDIFKSYYVYTSRHFETPKLKSEILEFSKLHFCLEILDMGPISS